MADEMREDAVGHLVLLRITDPVDDLDGVQRVVGQQGHAAQCQQDHDHQVAAEVHDVGADGRAERVHGEVPLHGNLVAQERAEVPEAAVQQREAQHVAFAQVPAPQRRELVTSGLRIGHRGPPVDGPGPSLDHDDHQRQDRSGDQDHGLDHVGPDHSLDASQHRVQRRQQPDGDQHDQCPAGQAETGPNQPDHAAVGDIGDGDRGGQHHHAHPEQPQHEHEQDAGQLTGSTTEAAVQVFIDAGQFQLHQEGQPDEADHQEDKGHDQPGQRHRGAVLDHLARRSQVRDGREQRGHDREADGEPGHLPPADEVVFAASLLP